MCSTACTIVFQNMASMVPADLDLGLVGFLALGAGAVLLMAYQCMQMCAALMSPPDDTAPVEAITAPAAASKGSARKKLVPGDIESGGRPAVFKPKAKLSKLSAGERPLQTPLVSGRGVDGGRVPLDSP